MSGGAEAPAVSALENPLAGPLGPLPATDPAEVLAFHRRLPGYSATPLLAVPALARELGVGDLLVKCESSRFGLPAFKMLGASWAVFRALSAELERRTGAGPGAWRDVDELAGRFDPLRPMALAAATDGNHGRAVARMARLLGLGARIFVPAGTSAARAEAIASEGAEVTVVDGGYDDAVARSASEAGTDCIVVSDTSWPGYDEIPRWVIDGYATMFVEIDDALGRGGRRPPDLVVVPVGVGALAAAAVAHLRAGPVSPRPAILGVEPSDAACVTASVLAGGLVTLPGEQHSIMAGLNCGTPSAVAWPLISRGVDAFVTIDDDWARLGVRRLAAVGVEAGETGAAAYGGLAALASTDTPAAKLLHEDASVLVLVTEGASDRPAWLAILGAEQVGP